MTDRQPRVRIQAVALRGGGGDRAGAVALAEQIGAGLAARDWVGSTRIGTLRLQLAPDAEPEAVTAALARVLGDVTGGPDA